MKLKKSYKLALCLLGLMLVGHSCKKQLVLNPTSSYSQQTFWQSESDVVLGLAGVYSSLDAGGDGLAQYINEWDAASDDAFWNPVNGLTTSWTTFEGGQQNSQTGGVINNVYTTYYQAIAQCNNFLANVTRVTTLSPASLAAYQAEVRTLRAYYYFQLTNVFGGVILTLAPEVAAETHPAKSTKAQVVAAMVADLQFAVANLTNNTLGSTTPGYTGRVIKGTAQGLLAKVYLFNGDYVNAAATASSLINDPTNPFSLFSDYRGLFCKNGTLVAGGQRASANHEIMLSARYQLPLLYHNFDLRCGYQVAYSALQPIANLANSFLCTDGLPTSSSPLYDPTHPYANRDPRLHYTMYCPGDYWPQRNITYTGVELPSVTGFILRKGLDESRAPFSNATLSDQDFVFLRYADVLLIYAEAQNEVAGADASVYSAINKVRARAGVANVTPGLSQAAMRTTIRNERRYEFALEGMRYFDLLRWQTAASALNGIINPGGNIRVFNDPTNYLMPFQIGELTTEGNLQQNPGY